MVNCAANASATCPLAVPLTKALTSSQRTTNTPPETAAPSSGNTNPLVDTFNQILEESITGLTKAMAEVAHNRAAEFLKDRDQLRAIAQAAGWAPVSGSSRTGPGGTATSTQQGSSAGTSGTTANDPIARLLVALGQTILLGIEQIRQNASSASDDDTTKANNTTSTCPVEKAILHTADPSGTATAAGSSNMPGATSA